MEIGRVLFVLPLKFSEVKHEKIQTRPTSDKSRFKKKNSYLLKQG